MPAVRRRLACRLVPRAAVFVQPLQHLELPAVRRHLARVYVPRAAVFARPLQHLNVSALRRPLARVLVPRAAVSARPPQHLEVPAVRRELARVFVPRVAVRTRPLQHLEVPAPRRTCARFLAPRAAVRGQHLQLFELSASRRCLTKEFLTRRCRRCTALKHPSSAARCSPSSSNRSPVAATAARIPRLTAGSRARSAGSSKCSDLRIRVTTRWSGRRGKASPASVGLAGVVTVATSPLVAVMSMCAASEDM